MNKQGRSFKHARILITIIPAVLLVGIFLWLSGLILIPSTVPVARAATDFYVSPVGSGNGSMGNPWGLQTALSHPPAIQPGDTIWLRGGTYTGCFDSWLEGSSSAPIWVKQYPGERAILDAGTSCSSVVLDIQGSYANFMGFEVTNSNPNWTASGDFANEPNGIYVNDSNNIKLINLIVHDMVGQGIGAWAENSTAEIYGSLVYYNGYGDYDHGIYAQNQTGTKRLVDNFVFHQASHGFHAYGSSDAYLNNFYVEGNTSFNNGILGSNAPSRNFLFGGGSLAQNLTFNNNNSYFPQSVFQGDAINLGYSAGCDNTTINNNYIYGSDVNVINCQVASMTGNEFYAREISGFNSATYPSNTYNLAIPAPKPSTNKIVVRPNQYDSSRANITVYNWQGQSSVNVSVAGVLSAWDTYELRNIQNYFGDIITGTYDGSGTISVPMTGHTVAAPVRFSSPASSFPEFGGFVLIKTGNNPPPPPPPPPSPNPSPLPSPSPSPSPNPSPTPGPTPSPIPVPPPPGLITSVPYLDGTLLLDQGTIYVIEYAKKRPIASMSVFNGFGYKLSNVISVSASSIATGDGLFTPSQRHVRGSTILHNGTVYFVGTGYKYGFPSAEVFSSWELKFKDLVPANEYDTILPDGPIVQNKN